MTDQTIDTPSVTWKERQRQIREQEILEVASKAFQEKGLHELQMDELAAQVGVSKGTLYLHFATKEALVLAVIMRSMRAMEAEMQAIVRQDVSVVERLTNLLRFSIIRSRAKVVRMAQLNSPELFTMLRNHPEAQAAVERFTELLTALIIEGQERGELTTALPASLLAQTFGAISHPRPQHDPQTSADELEATVANLIAFYLHGAATTPTSSAPWPSNTPDQHTTVAPN
jgi:AcrR family transcriptional regulator